MNKKLVSAAAAASVLAGALAVTSTSAIADGKEAKEKCYGVVKAGQNDCQANGHSCAAQATVDNDANEWLLVPEGLCERLAGGSLKPGGKM